MLPTRVAECPERPDGGMPHLVRLFDERQPAEYHVYVEEGTLAALDGPKLARAFSVTSLGSCFQSAGF